MKLSACLGLALAACIENIDAYFALVARPHGTDRLLPAAHADGDTRLEALVTDLEELARDAELAGAYVDDRKPGPKAQNAYALVTELDILRERFTGSLIRRSSYPASDSKDYIELVCRIADPEIGSGTIEEAMKNRIRRRD